MASRPSTLVEPTHLQLHLGRDWYFTSSTYNGERMYHFRVFDKNGERLFPTGKGICLRDVQLKRLVDHSQDTAAEQTPADYELHLGYGVYVNVKERAGQKWFDIRKFYKPDGAVERLHSKKGAMLSCQEFQRFIELIPKIYQHSPSLKNIQPCDCFAGNPLAYLTCPECNPFDHVNYY